MKRFLLLFSMLTCMLIIGGCKKEFIPAAGFEKGFEYFPLQKGKFIAYKVDSIIYDDKGLTITKSSAYVKVLVDDVLEKNEASEKFRILKYWKRMPEDEWQLTDVESATKTTEEVIVTEENLPFIKMVFPNEINRKWNGNALFDESIVVKIAGESMRLYERWQYEITTKNVMYKIGDPLFQDCMDVIEVDDNLSSRSKRYSRAIYAKDIGLIWKEMKMYDTTNPQTGVPWEAYAEKGYSLLMEIIEHN